MAPPASSSDIATMWEEACQRFEQEAGPDNEFATVAAKPPAEIKAMMDEELGKFKSRRHDGRKMDVMRKSVNKYLDIIHGIATIASQLGKAAFPPAEAVLAAFTLVVRTSKVMSEVLDKVEKFFQIMGFFAERLELLDNRLPDGQKEKYKEILLRVFASMLRVSAVVVKSMSSRRATQFAKVLVRQSGGAELEETVKELHENVQHFDRATVAAILAVGVETQRELRDMRGKMDDIHNIIVRGWQLSATSSSPATMSEEKNHNSKVSTDPGSKATMALRVIREILDEGDPLAKNQRVICDRYQREIAPHTLAWLSHEEELQRVTLSELSFLWISGDAGMGKTVIVASIVKRLNEEPTARLGSPDSLQPSVAYFFFHQEYAQPRPPIESMIRSCAVQLAEADKDYRMTIAHYVESTPRSNLTDWEVGWKDLFLDMFPKESSKRLILVLDGLESYDATFAEESSKELTGIFKKLLKRTKDSEARIQIIFTSSNSFFSDQDTLPISQGHVWIDKKKMQSDMYWIARNAIRSSSRLKGLGAKLRKKIARCLKDQADNIRYIEHMVRRLSAIGRESKVEAELRALPHDSTKFYELILLDCAKDRDDEELYYLKRLYAWLAYSKSPLSLGAVNRLSRVMIYGTFDFKLEDEIDRSPGILRLLTQSSDQSDEETESGTDEATEHNNEDDTTGNSEGWVAYETSQSLVLFQERSLRAFLRRPGADPHPRDLRSSAPAANRLILDEITRILTQLSFRRHFPDDPSLSFTEELLHYAAEHWLGHLFDIDIDALEDSECIALASNLYTLLSVPCALLSLEYHAWISGCSDGSTDAAMIIGEKAEKKVAIATAGDPNLAEQMQLRLSEASQLLTQATAFYEPEKARGKDHVRAMEFEVAISAGLRVNVETLLGNIAKAQTFIPTAKFGSEDREFEKAAKLTGRTHEVDVIYAETVTGTTTWWAADLRAKRARIAFRQSVMDDLPTARELAKQYLDEGGDSEEVHRVLASNLIGQFRHSKDPAEKAALFKDLKDLLIRMSRVDGADEYDTKASYLSAPLALMARKLGPAKDYHGYLDKTFHSCVNALTDSKAWNDSYGLRTLARILMCLPGFSEEARISLSCRFYVLDRKIFEDENGVLDRKILEDENGDSDTNEKEQDKEDPDIESPDPGSFNSIQKTEPDLSTVSKSSADDGDARPTEQNPEVTGNIPAPDNTATTETAEPRNQKTKDLSRSTPYCDACSGACSIQDGPVYLCVYFTEIDLCQACYDEKIAREEANNPDWRAVCWKGHPFIKAPAEGWRGVEDGVLFLKDSREIKFRDWLDELQKKWDLAWEKFWLDESLL
ncbi:hypothetical protein B0T22DRAFT_523098 [Podospora appendiculata]|uniref:Fungal STAND N-terminal Goodbye domain-containing protein n=1 Tax=Podospora appendiculata TaxID=314037 RepID=A0AAE1C7R4_9PEZI|nr:hypothetical protein B0T22DRAFT_523098 [Podospora appendiculata]